MLEHGVVQDDDAGLAFGTLIDFRVELIIAQMVESDVGLGSVDLHFSQTAQSGEQRGCVIGNSGAGGRQRSVVSDFHGRGRGPKSPVPTPTQVEPLSMATSRSGELP